MSGSEWDRAVAGAFEALRSSDGYRSRRIVTPLDATHVEWQGRRLVNFASNDYLGLSHHPAVIAAVADAARSPGAGSGASPLITGYGPIHARAERRLAVWKGTEAAVLLPSGYQANHAAVQALAAGARGAGRVVRFLLDKLCHASLIDAVRGSEAPFRVFPHNQLAKLERLLSDAEPSELQVVVTESVFSMDGDAADLAGIASLKRKRPFTVLLDDAHSTGVYGEGGRGLAWEQGNSDVADVTVVTLSKAAGSAGGVVCGSAIFGEAVVNASRAYIYSTGVAPSVAAAAEAAVAVMAGESWRQRRVRELARRVRTELAERGLKIPAGDSPIVPVILGTESAALHAANSLAARGILALAIRPPTVPRGMSRLRVTLSCEHSDEEVAGLIDALGNLAG